MPYINVYFRSISWKINIEIFSCWWGICFSGWNITNSFLSHTASTAVSDTITLSFFLSEIGKCSQKYVATEIQLKFSEVNAAAFAGHTVLLLAMERTLIRAYFDHMPGNQFWTVTHVTQSTKEYSSWYNLQFLSRSIWTICMHQKFTCFKIINKN